MLDPFMYPNDGGVEIWPLTAADKNSVWDGFRPSKVRVTYTGSVPSSNLELWVCSPEPNEDYSMLDTNSEGYASMQEVDLDWSECDLDIGGLDMWTINDDLNAFHITKIEFYYDPALEVDVPIALDWVQLGQSPSSPITILLNSYIDQSTLNSSSVKYMLNMANAGSTVSPFTTKSNKVVVNPPFGGWQPAGHIELTTSVKNVRGASMPQTLNIPLPFANSFGLTSYPNTIQSTDPLSFIFNQAVDANTIAIGTGITLTDASNNSLFTTTAYLTQSGIPNDTIVLNVPVGGWPANVHVTLNNSLMDVHSTMLNSIGFTVQVTAPSNGWLDVTGNFYPSQGFTVGAGFVFDPSTVDANGFGVLLASGVLDQYKVGYRFWRFTFTENGVEPVGSAAFANMRDVNNAVVGSGYIPSGRFDENGNANLFGVNAPIGWEKFNIKSANPGSFVVTKIEVNTVVTDFNTVPLP